MNNKIQILCTLGPSSLNKKFLKFANKKVDLLRINLSHIEIKDLKKIIDYIKNFTKIPICVDTEGAQIRTKIKSSKFFKKDQIFKIYKKKKLYKFISRRNIQ